jgi:hypothetical protein
MRKDFSIGRLSVQFGWFHGEPFTLFKMGFGEFYSSLESVCIIQVQVAKICFSIIWNK